VDWYVRMIFATDEDEDADVGEGEREGEGEGGLSVDENGAGAGGSSSKALKSTPATGSWAGVKWAVAGKMWKCDKWPRPLRLYRRPLWARSRARALLSAPPPQPWPPAQTASRSAPPTLPQRLVPRP
jgi:hypothetical protein